MTLSVLVIRTPGECFDCDICSTYYDDEHEEYVRYCEAVGGQVPSSGIDKNCPLRPLPKKRNIDRTLVFGGYGTSVEEALVRGYNACLDEITGETE